MDREKRKVGLGLAIGVVLLPIVFSWATLREGYNTAFRIVAVGWMVLIFMFIAASPSKDSSTVAGATPKDTVAENDEVVENTPKPGDAQANSVVDVAEEKTESEPALVDGQCNTLECLGRQHFAAASRLCTKSVERQADYDVDWTRSIVEGRFVPYKMSDESETAFLMLGDSVKFQNGFGAWQNMTYICKFESATESVDEVVVSAGRL